MKILLRWIMFLSMTVYWLIWMPLYITLETIGLIASGICYGVLKFVDLSNDFDARISRYHKGLFAKFSDESDKEVTKPRLMQIIQEHERFRDVVLDYIEANGSESEDMVSDAMDTLDKKVRIITEWSE